ncbi:hypothetical protein HF650_01340 [Kosakonia sp. SMBL-WEM22]|uniref:hypothetical protein n=1 Tax=Kosakonia sp. SMBL-WEM22 TaxID=2725560 RepID=UPI001659F3B8|nr:hypothetical protein [Kosakonia sp. SMBL-WEM22]QNQ18521.1 hypothetical protein HF650_01340 [Kosakonia sp. SMBL-WEM22]
MNINKDENVLVILKNNHHYYWFAAFKEMWVMDRIKWVADFVRNGIDDLNFYIHQERYDIPVFNEQNADEFIRRLIKDGYLYNKNEIADEFYKRLSIEDSWWSVYDLMPDLFIDFDEKKLYSQYVENMHYEKYVPQNWVGEVVDFCDDGLLDDCERFWIRNGMDYRKNLLKG